MGIFRGAQGKGAAGEAAAESRIWNCWCRDFHAAGRGLQGWNQRNECAEDHDDHAYPDPVDQRVDEELDDGLLVVRVGAFEDDVEIVLKGRMDSNDGRGLGMVRVDEVDATLRREASDQLAIVIDVEQGK